MKKLIITLFLTLVFVSCQKDEDQVLNVNDQLIGNWINPQYVDTLLTYSKADYLIENEPGFTFKTENKVICRQNSGWCGTPPITTADYEGTWTWNDSIVNITVGYWGGTVDYTWKVIALTSHGLVISVVKYEYHEKK